MTHYSMILDGALVEGDDRFDIVNPATAEAFATAPVSTVSQLEDAVASARRAFTSWSTTPLEVRREALLAIGAKLEAHAEDLARLVTLEQGKPLNGFGGFGSRFEVGAAQAWCAATAQLDLPVEVLVDDDQSRIELHRKPVGVVGSITPWNWPLMIAIWHVIPAIYAGNAVIIKPSSLTPLSTLKLVELANEILPPGVLNVLTGEAGLGRAMSSHPGIDKIVFTGSTSTGKAIMANAANTLKRLTLELGGNDAGIVLPGANIEAIAPMIFGGAFLNAGQTCGALKRLYVHDSQYEDMCEVLAGIAGATSMGDGMDEAMDFGPVQNRSQLNIVTDLASKAKASGGRFLTGGVDPIDRAGYFFPITLVADLADGHELVDLEPFGPILPIIRYTSVDDVIAAANNNPNGLGGSVWGEDLELAAQVAPRLECGTVWVNGHGGINPFVPFGGIKQSGFGVEFGLEGLKECTLPQAIHLPKA